MILPPPDLDQPPGTEWISETGLCEHGVQWWVGGYFLLDAPPEAVKAGLAMARESVDCSDHD